MPGGHTDGNFMCPEENLCAQIRIETWIIREVFKISAHLDYHSLTFSESFPVIPNTCQFDQYGDDLLEKMIFELKTYKVPTGRTS